MKKLAVTLLFIASQIVTAQQIRFNKDLNQFCKNSVKEFSRISAERKKVLDEIAAQIAHKKFIVFTCQTNSRRTVLLQTWMQAAFYYYGLDNKVAFSLGDTVTEIYPTVVDVLKEAGFSYSESNTKPKGYILSISEEYQENVIVSKNNIGKIDTLKSVLVIICSTGETSNVSAMKHYSLPYQNPTSYDKTTGEKEKYAALNKEIAIEMLYIADKAKHLILNTEDYR